MFSKLWVWMVVLLAGCGAAALSGPARDNASGAASAAAEPAPEVTQSAAAEEDVPAAHAGVPQASAIELLGISGPDRPWEEMSSVEREWYMVGKVQPIMWEMFRGFSEAGYEQFSCDTCHGKDGKERGYAMPAVATGALPAPGSQSFKEILDTRIGRFMKDEVSPTMAKLMGKPAFDSARGHGFGCFDCHVKE